MLVGKKKSSESVRLETVPKNHLTIANVTTPGSTIKSPVKKLARQRAKKDFLTCEV
jgi:hypothetical protein